MEISRRKFLKGAAAGAAGIAALGMAGAISAEESNVMTSAQYSRAWSFEIPPEPITDIAETLEADVVVVGAGTAGLVTANSAMDAGLSVILVSASEKPVSRGGSNNAIYCKAFEERGMERISPWIFQKEIYGQTCKVDQKKWFKSYNNNEEAINWAIDIMEGAGYKIAVEQGTPMDADSLYYQPTASIGWAYGDDMEPEKDLVNMTGMMQPLFVRQLTKRLTENGAQVYFKTIGKQLVRGGEANGQEGRVDAVICAREDGSYAKYVGKKGVVLATGDFSADREMMYRYCPEWAPRINDEVYDAPNNYDAPFIYGGLMKGDGQKMGLWVGAAWQRNFPNCPMDYNSNAGPTMLYGNHPGLQVDRNGERFMNEWASTVLASKTVSLQDEGVCYAIWDVNFAKHFQTSSSWNADTISNNWEDALAAWDEQVELGNYVKADTLEELMEKVGLPASTLKTVERYNEMCRAGEDTDFYKQSDKLFEIKEAPFYAQKSSAPSFLTVLGGLRTNANMQVCDESDKPIPGLYNVGTMVGDMYAGTYTFQVEGSCLGMCCITFGYLTGKYIAENE